MVHRKDTSCNLIGTITVPNAAASVVMQGDGGVMTVEGEGAVFIVCLPGSPPS